MTTVDGVDGNIDESAPDAAGDEQLQADPANPAQTDTQPPIIVEPPARKRAWLAALIGALLYLAYYVGITIFNAHNVQLPPLGWVAFAVATTVGYLLLLVITIRLFCHLTLSSRQETALMFLALALFLVLNPNVRIVALELFKGHSFDTAFGKLAGVETPPVLGIIVPFCLVLTGVFFGQLVARLIRERSMLVPVALVAGMIDFWGVYWGPVNFMSNKAPVAVTRIGMALSAGAAVPDPIKHGLAAPLAWLASIAPPEAIGLGDFVFLAFFLTCAYRLGFSAKRTMWGIFWGLLAASAIMALNGQVVFGQQLAIDYLPGLLFICGGVLIANIRDWQLSRQEWAMTGVLVTLLAMMISVSVTRAELAKQASLREARAHAPIGYMLSPCSAADSVLSALAHIPTKADEKGDVLIVNAIFQYENASAGVQMRGWQVVALQRLQPYSLKNCREFVLYGGLKRGAENGWQVMQLHNLTPDLSQRLLDQAGVKIADPQVLSQATGVPHSALAWRIIPPNSSHS